MVLPSGSPEGRTQLRITECPGQGDRAPQTPEEQDAHRIGGIRQLKPQAGEHPGADHIGNDQRGGAAGSDLSGE